MSADETSIRYVCPFCDWDGSSPKSVKSHVSSTKKGDHIGVNGYTMHRTIETTEDPSRLPMIDRIRRAAQQFDEPLDKDNADKVAEAASDTEEDLADYVSRYMVLRIWKEAGYDVDIFGRTSLYYDDVTDKQKTALNYLYHTNLTHAEIDEKFDTGTNYTTKTNQKYGYMTRPKFVCDKLKQNDPTTENDSDDQTTENNQITIGNKKLRALEAAGVEHKVEVDIKDDQFEAVKKLIESGYSDIAEEIFEE